MKKYEAPQLKIVYFSAQDILTFSNDNEVNLPAMPVGDEE